MKKATPASLNPELLHERGKPMTLTTEQIQFAKVLGRILAEGWLREQLTQARVDPAQKEEVDGVK